MCKECRLRCGQRRTCTHFGIATSACGSYKKIMVPVLLLLLTRLSIAVQLLHMVPYSCRLALHFTIRTCTCSEHKSRSSSATTFIDTSSALAKLRIQVYQPYSCAFRDVGVRSAMLAGMGIFSLAYLLENISELLARYSCIRSLKAL